VSVNLVGYGRKDRHCNGSNGSSRNLRNNLEQSKGRDGMKTARTDLNKTPADVTQVNEVKSIMFEKLLF